ncbi:hypothetical protein LCGC14_0963790 [marine sediment metagenome]|uniref:Phospholipase A2 domain-containing protein n=1 Tax=marine sediment metagenome TaxID=412755 RepID=A0A0F9NZQ7_9ZZZZ
MKIFLAFAVALIPIVAHATEWRPCGSGSDYRAHRLVPQGWKGADFRSACAKHDHHYRERGITKAQADCEFLQDMLAQCKYSKRPRQAKHVARFMYRAVRRYGRY